jgi:imidazolonepropionase-like amidohydrolase
MNRLVRGLALLAAATALAQTQRAPGGVLALNDVTIINGTGAAARTNARIVIRGERIEASEDAAQPLPAGAVVWNLHGMTVIPGLIDAHVHLTNGTASDGRIPETLRWGLLGGVTSVRDMGGDAVLLESLARAMREAGQAGLRIYYSTLVAGPQWFADPRPRAVAHGGVAGEVAWMRAVTPTSKIPAIITAGKATGATGLKIYADLPPDLVAKVTAEAHRRGLKVWSHSAVFPTKPSEVVAAGVDVVSHSNYLGAEGMNPPPATYEAARRGIGIDYAASPVDGEAITRLLRLMKEKGTILDQTLFVTNAGKRGEDDPVWVWTVAVTRRAHEMGVPLAAGTDSFGRPGADAVPNIHKEMQLLVEKCGLTPLEAIGAATLGGARAIGIDKDYGTVAAGKVADLVVLREDPSADIRKTTGIAAVVKGGVVWQR